MRTSARSEFPDWRLWAPGAVLAFLASRLLLLVVALAFGQPPLPELVPAGWAGSAVPAAFAAWDSIFYIGIAGQGYHVEPIVLGYRDWAFFPAFPVLIRTVSLLTGGDLALAGMLAANGALLAGLLLTGIAIAEQEDAGTAPVAQSLVALAPGAVAFGMAYSDSLALAASAGLYVAARHRRRWLAGLLFALVTLTRPPGILLGVPLAIVLWEQADRKTVRAIVRQLAPLALGPVALLAFAAFQGVALGDPLAFLHAQADWDRPSTRPASAFLSGVLGLSFAVYTVLAVLLLRSRLPWGAKAVGLTAYLSVLVSGRMLSNARYVAIGWPIAWMLARQGRVGRVVTLVVSCCGFLLYAVLNLSQHLPP